MTKKSRKNKSLLLKILKKALNSTANTSNIYNTSNQKTDFKKVNTKIIFSEKALLKLFDMIGKVVDMDYREFGVYFFGHINPGYILFDDCSNDFALTDIIFNNGEVSPTKENNIELAERIEMALADNLCTAVMHFHTHPDYSYKDGNVIEINQLVMSEKDLRNYEYNQKNLQPSSHNKVLYLGGMLSRNKNKPQLSVVMYDEYNEEFNYIDNIYLYDGEELVKVDTENFLNSPNTSLDITEENKTKILRRINNDLW